MVRKPEGKRPLGSPTRTRRENTTTHILNKQHEGMNYIHMVKNRDHWWALVNTVIRIPWASTKFDLFLGKQRTWC